MFPFGYVHHTFFIFLKIQIGVQSPVSSHSQYSFHMHLMSCYVKQIHGGMLRGGLNLSKTLHGNPQIEIYGKLRLVYYDLVCFWLWNLLISAGCGRG